MRKDQVLMGIGVMVAITNLLDQAWSSVLVPVWARDSGYGVAAVGLIGRRRSVAAAILGSVIAAAYGERLPRFKIYLVGVLHRRGAAVRRARVRLPAVGGAGGGSRRRAAASGFLNPILGAVLFERIPKPLMGRVSSMNIAMSWSLIPFGGLLGGIAVTAIGLSPALLAIGTAYFLTTMLPAVQPRWREIDNRHPAGGTESVSPLNAPATSITQVVGGRLADADPDALAGERPDHDPGLVRGGGEVGGAVAERRARRSCPGRRARPSPGRAAASTSRVRSPTSASTRSSSSSSAASDATAAAWAIDETPNGSAHARTAAATAGCATTYPTRKPASP